MTRRVREPVRLQPGELRRRGLNPKSRLYLSSNGKVITGKQYDKQQDKLNKEIRKDVPNITRKDATLVRKFRQKKYDGLQKKEQRRIHKLFDKYGKTDTAKDSLIGALSPPTK